MNLFNIFKKQTRAGEDLQQVRSLFERMERDTKWDLKQKMLYGYFFYCPVKDNLEKLANYLENNGFMRVSIDEVKPDELFKLHIEEICIHTPESLVERSRMMNDLVIKYKVMNYDGFDIGPIP